MRSKLLIAVAAGLAWFTIAPPMAAAQSTSNLAVARVRYNTLKNTTGPDGELKLVIDAIDRELAEATRLGRTGEVRRLLARATALLNGRPWTDLDEFDASLVLRTDRLVLDPGRPWHARLEQIFAPALELTAPLTVRASVRPLLSQPPGAPEAHPLARLDGVARDLRESPLKMELSLAKMGDGPHMVDVEVLDADRSLGTASLRIWTLKSLDERSRALEASVQAVPDAVRADVLYPLDYMVRVNGGLIEAGAFDFAKELEAAEVIAAAAKRGGDPFAGRTGDFERHYLLEPAREIMPYRVYVPRAYDGTKAFPLLIALHGLGVNEDSFFDSYQRRVPALAEERGYLVAAPLGYRTDGFYGSDIAGSWDPATRRARNLSEQDVMEVLGRMRRDYNVDARRIYLMGHSMGAIGTWHLAARYPDTWAAIAAFSGTGAPDRVALMKGVPQFVVHGDADPTVAVTGSRNMVAEMKKLGVDVTYVEVAGGGHVDVVVPNLAGAFDFFDRKRRSASGTQQQSDEHRSRQPCLLTFREPDAITAFGRALRAAVGRGGLPADENGARAGGPEGRYGRSPLRADEVDVRLLGRSDLHDGHAHGRDAANRQILTLESPVSSVRSVSNGSASDCPRK